MSRSCVTPDFDDLSDSLLMVVAVPMVEVGKVDDNAKEGNVDLEAEVDVEEDEDVEEEDGVGDKVDRTDTDPGKSEEEDPPPVVNKPALADRSFTKRFS